MSAASSVSEYGKTDMRFVHCTAIEQQSARDGCARRSPSRLQLPDSPTDGCLAWKATSAPPICKGARTLFTSQQRRIGARPARTRQTGWPRGCAGRLRWDRTLFYVRPAEPGQTTERNVSCVFGPLNGAVAPADSLFGPCRQLGWCGHQRLQQQRKRGAAGCSDTAPSSILARTGRPRRSRTTSTSARAPRLTSDGTTTCGTMARSPRSRSASTIASAPGVVVAKY